MTAQARIQNRTASPTEQDPRWQAVAGRDKAFDGQFFYSVKTTGVYCRPSCAARLANPKNVRFHRTQAEARQEGFRPCKRCKPDQIVAAADAGTAAPIRFATGQCSLGTVLLARSPDGICAILLGHDAGALERDLHRRFANAAMLRDDARLETELAKVLAFTETPKDDLDLPLDMRGTAFQRRVWKALAKIPAGKTASYGDIARRIGSPNAVRAVAQACAANAIALAVPCHRVVRSDGALSGYRWGAVRKRALLAREAGAA
jgi:O-6-methylguanine DNA methyltransferase